MDEECLHLSNMSALYIYEKSFFSVKDHIIPTKTISQKENQGYDEINKLCAAWLDIGFSVREHVYEFYESASTSMSESWKIHCWSCNAMDLAPYYFLFCFIFRCSFLCFDWRKTHSKDRNQVICSLFFQIFDEIAIQ